MRRILLSSALLVIASLSTSACLEPQRFELDVNSPDGLLSFGLSVAVNSSATTTTTTPTYEANFSATAVTVREGDTAQIYTVKLSDQPTENVTVTITNPSGNLTVTPPSLTFTSSNWETTQNVSVTGIDNQVRTNMDQSITLTNSLTSGDTNYSGKSTSVVITLQDNDKYTFVAAITTNGNMGGIGQTSGADDRCNGDANRPDTSVTYKAFITGRYNGGATIRRACTTANCGCAGTCNTTEGSDWVMQANTGYLRSDGATYIGTTNAAAIFFPFPLTNSWNPGGQAWTGMQFDWTIPAAGKACETGSNDWVNAGGTSGGSNLIGSTNNGAVSNGSLGCGAAVSLICIEQ